MNMIGTDGTEIRLLTPVNKKGLAKVSVMKRGNLLRLNKGAVIAGFKVKGGIIQFTEKTS